MLALLENLPLFLLNIFSIMKLKDFVDVFVVAAVIYVVMVFIKRTRFYFVLYIFFGFIGLNYFAEAIDFKLTQTLFRPFLTFFMVVLVVVFQRDIRKFFEWFSAAGHRLAANRKKIVSSEAAQKMYEAIIELSKRKFGALIVLPGEQPLEGFIEGGINLEGKISVPLFLSIFDPSSPGHDGAIIIENNRIKKFGVHLPLALKFDKYESVGTRHRAGAGITEATDALAIIVSEERGTISLASEGKLKKINDMKILEEVINKFIKENVDLSRANASWHAILTRNWQYKLAAFIISLMLWYMLIFS